MGLIAPLEQAPGIGPYDLQDTGVAAEDFSKGLRLDERFQQQQEVARQADAVFGYQTDNLIVDILDADGLQGTPVKWFADLF